MHEHSPRPARQDIGRKTRDSQSRHDPATRTRRQCTRHPLARARNCDAWIRLRCSECGGTNLVSAPIHRTRIPQRTEPLERTRGSGCTCRTCLRTREKRKNHHPRILARIMPRARIRGTHRWQVRRDHRTFWRVDRRCARTNTLQKPREHTYFFGLLGCGRAHSKISSD